MGEKREKEENKGEWLMFLVHSFAAFGLFTSCMYYLFMKRNFQVWGEKKKKIRQAAWPLTGRKT